MSKEKQNLKIAIGKSYEKCNASIVLKDASNFEKALSKFKQRVKNSKVMNDLYDRMSYIKPSAKRREIIQKAVTRQKSRRIEE